MSKGLRYFIGLNSCAWSSAAINEFFLPDMWIGEWWSIPLTLTWLYLLFTLFAWCEDGGKPLRINTHTLFSKSNHWRDWVAISGLGTVGLGVCLTVFRIEDLIFNSALSVGALVLGGVFVFGVIKWIATSKLLVEMDAVSHKKIALTQTPKT